MTKNRCNLAWFLHPNCLFKVYWINEPPLEIYIRNTHDYLYNKKYKTLHIATINIGNINKQGRGSFRRFLANAIQIARYRGFDLIKVENVLNPRFQKFFDSKHTWIKQTTGTQASYHKFL